MLAWRGRVWRGVVGPRPGPAGQLSSLCALALNSVHLNVNCRTRTNRSVTNVRRAGPAQHSAEYATPCSRAWALGLALSSPHRRAAGIICSNESGMARQACQCFTGPSSGRGAVRLHNPTCGPVITGTMSVRIFACRRGGGEKFVCPLDTPEMHALATFKLATE